MINGQAVSQGLPGAVCLFPAGSRHSTAQRKPPAVTGELSLRYRRLLQERIHQQLHQRLTRARDLLRQPGHKITAIALTCSFNDSSQFSRTFKD